MNPVYVLDLGFVLPLLVVAAVSLLSRRPGAIRLAVPLLVFMLLLSFSIVSMALGGAADGQALEPPMLVIFGVVGFLSAALAWLALEPRPVGARNAPASRPRIGAA